MANLKLSKLSIGVMGWVFIVGSAWNIIAWLRLFFSADSWFRYVADTNNAGVTFTYTSFRVFVLGTVVIQAIQLISGLLFIKQKEAGRRLFLYSWAVFILYDLVWLTINLLTERTATYFIIPVIINGAMLWFFAKILNRPAIKEQFK